MPATSYIKLNVDAFGHAAGEYLQVDLAHLHVQQALSADLASVVLAPPAGITPAVYAPVAPKTPLDLQLSQLLADPTSASGTLLGGVGSSDASVAAQVTSGAATQAALRAAFDPAGAATTVLTGSVQGGATVLRSLVFLYDTQFSFPARIRPVESARRTVRVRNTGANALQLGYGTGDNSNYNSPPSWTYTVNSGQEFVDTSGNGRALFMREAVNGSPISCTVYAEIGVA